MRNLTRHDVLQYGASLTALVFSALALVVAFMELGAAREQLDANVWPYVEIDMSIQNDAAQLALENKGLGPAVVREVHVSVPDGDGGFRRVTDLMELAPSGWRERGGINVDMSDLVGDVLAVGESENIAMFTGEGLGIEMLPTFYSLRVEVCFCSITETCWREYTGNIQGPEPVAQCQPAENDMAPTIRSIFTPPETEAETP